MKNIQNTIFFLSFMAFFGCQHKSESQSIYIKKTDDKYSLEASYPESKTLKVQAYMEKTLKFDQLFTSFDDIRDAEICLGPMRFHIDTKPGYLLITFKKQLNSDAAYQKLEKMCIGIKERLK